jgi:hypothetical protein
MAGAESPEELAAKARFVFRGTVQQLNATTIPEVRDTSHTAVVRVDQTMQAPKSLRHYTGKEITVRLDDPNQMKAGDEAMFYTDAWLFGNGGVAVRSLGEHDVGTRTAAPLAPGSDPVTNLEDSDAQAHYDGADLVVSGTVSGVTVPPDARDNRGPREHDPQWREAVVDVEQVHKGQPTRQVIVRFPASLDRAWHRAPKLRAGDRGHFLLHGAETGPLVRGAEEEPRLYTALHREDFERADHPGPIHRMLNRMKEAGKR